MGRRGSDDLKWQACKKEVARRDGGICCFCKTMTPLEYKRFVASFGTVGIPYTFLKTIDPAHRVAVSTDQSIMYDPDNVFHLCRIHHDRLDAYKDPITDEKIDRETHDRYWDRIAKTREKPKGVQLPDFFF